MSCKRTTRAHKKHLGLAKNQNAKDLATARSRREPRPSTATMASLALSSLRPPVEIVPWSKPFSCTSVFPGQLPIDPHRLEELVAANLSQWAPWQCNGTGFQTLSKFGAALLSTAFCSLARLSEVYRADDVSEPLPEIPGISLSADCLREDLHTGSVKVALVTAELPGRHRTLFVVFKGSSYLLDFINWNLEHDYEVIGDGTHFMHKGAAGIMRNLFFLKVQRASSFAKQLDAAYNSGVRHLVVTGHSLGGMYAMCSMYFIWREMQTLVPATKRHLALCHEAQCCY